MSEPTRIWPDSHEAKDPLRPILQGFVHQSEAFLNALEQSDKWLEIEPNLASALRAIIVKEEFISAFAVCDKLENKVSAEDLFNLHGFLSSRMAIASMALIREELSEEALRVALLVYNASATGAAFQRLQGAGPVKRALAEWEPHVERDGVRQAGCSAGGIHSGESRANEADDRHSAVIEEAEKLFNADRSNRKWVVRTLSQRPLKSDSEAYSKRHIERILKKAGI